jgi:hypothetical protein
VRIAEGDADRSQFGNRVKDRRALLEGKPLKLLLRLGVPAHLHGEMIPLMLSRKGGERVGRSEPCNE